MTDAQRNNALATVMEADGWEPHYLSLMGGEMYMWVRPQSNGSIKATENDMIAACVRWLLANGRDDWTRWLSNGLEVWRDGKHIKVKDLSPLDRLLAAVADSMEDG